MTHIEQAIKEAESAGYDSEYPFIEGNLPLKVFRRQREIQHVAFLDPSFWQALGKARGWKKECNDCFLAGFARKKYCERCISDGYLHQWHSFINVLASNGTPEEFFASIV